MRRLVVRITAIGGLVAALLAAGTGVATGIAWPIVVLRAALALLIVVLMGAGIGLILMRTVLRRYYEQRHVPSGDRHVRADR